MACGLAYLGSPTAVLTILIGHYQWDKFKISRGHLVQEGCSISAGQEPRKKVHFKLQNKHISLYVVGEPNQCKSSCQIGASYHAMPAKLMTFESLE